MSSSDEAISTNEHSMEEEVTEYQLTPIFSYVLYEHEIPDAPSIHDLNEDCLDAILSYLDTVELLGLALVCKRWYNYALHHMSCLTSLALNPMFSIFKIDRAVSPKGFVALLIMTRKNLQRLDLSGSSLQLDYTCCKAIANLCPDLEELDLTKVKVDRKLAIAFCSHLPSKLKSLVLKDCDCLKEKCLKKVLMNAKSLQKLDISFNRKITGACITRHLTRNKLTHLNLRCCQSLKKSTFKFILLNYHKTLQHLDLYGCSPKDLISISFNGIPQLLELRTFIAPDWTAAGEKLAKILKLFPNLEKLDISHCLGYFNNRALFSNVTTSCPNIVSLTINGSIIHDADELSSLHLLSRLQHLVLDNICNEFDFSRFVLATLIKCTKLETISMKKCTIDDDAVCKIISHFPCLKTIDLRNCVYPLTGSFIEDTLNITRRSPLKVLLQGTTVHKEDFPEISEFLNVSFSILHDFEDEFEEGWGFPDHEVDGFGDFPLNEFHDLDIFDAHDEFDIQDDFDDPNLERDYDEDEYWEGGYAVQMGQLGGYVDIPVDEAGFEAEAGYEAAAGVHRQGQGPAQDAWNEAPELVDAYNEAAVHEAYNEEEGPLQDAWNEDDGPETDIWNEAEAPECEALNEAEWPVQEAYNEAEEPLQDAWNEAEGPAQDVWNEAEAPEHEALDEAEAAPNEHFGGYFEEAGQFEGYGELDIDLYGGYEGDYEPDDYEADEQWH